MINSFPKMKLGFSAKRDGFDSKKWHDICDNRGKTLIIIKTKDNFIFGGFTEVGWTAKKSKWRKKDRKNSSGYIIDPKAFIFSLRNDKNDRKPERFTIKKGKEEIAIYYDQNFAPNFGEDLEFYSDFQPIQSNFGESYNLPNGIKYGTDKARSYLAGSYDEWEVDEFETYLI
ncbi:pep-cterm sorting domain-containing protein [Anaeramoeba ignava]|uniref:Pep-cterm sorting domain-containing protein n=1 Tax=Anaeramoeba ignava TaxID=1746090 RepID=A0A9Q0LTP9_ANAIG|nr:pep-cterm sorting domain-containing protein [Anaeramoeba ignava]